MRQREDEIGGGRERDVRSDEDYYDDDGNDRGIVKKKKNTSVPDHLLRRSMTESMPLNAHPLALSTAITALRFAIRHPLTNYSEVR